jgi:CheY-like chemotaxis protein
MKFPSKEFIQVIGTRLGFGVLRLEPESGVGVVCPLDEMPADVCIKTAAAPENPNWLAAKPMTGFEKLREEVLPENPDTEVGALLAQLSKSAAQYEPERAVETKALTQGTLVAGFSAKDNSKLTAAFGSHTGVGAAEFLPWSSILAGPAHRLVVAYVPSTRIANHERETLRTLLEEGRRVVVVGSRVAMQELGFPWPPPAGKVNLEFIPTPWTGSELAACLERMLGPSQVLERPSQAAAAAAPTVQVAPPPGNSVRRIVIADTDPITRALVESSLAIPGTVECEAVEDGEAALRLIDDRRPDLLVMEIALPNRDGFQLLAEIKRSTALRRTRVIVLTTRTAEVDVLRAFGLGADDYVTKPFSPLELRARVKRLLAPGREADPV